MIYSISKHSERKSTHWSTFVPNAFVAHSHYTFTHARQATSSSSSSLPITCMHSQVPYFVFITMWTIVISLEWIVDGHLQFSARARCTLLYKVKTIYLFVVSLLIAIRLFSAHVQWSNQNKFAKEIENTCWQLNVLHSVHWIRVPQRFHCIYCSRFKMNLVTGQASSA